MAEQQASNEDILSRRQAIIVIAAFPIVSFSLLTLLILSSDLVAFLTRTPPTITVLALAG